MPDSIHSNMKKLLIILIAAIMPLLAAGQAQITTKKVKISDFTSKITKIVLTGSDFYDAALQDEVKARWRVSPYEFCTFEEFESMRNDNNYYFLLTTNAMFKKESEPGLDVLTLVKGGTGATINSMLEIVYLPFASTEDPSGRELTFLPAFLDIIQDHTLNSMDKDINGYTGLSNYTLNMAKAANMTIVFSEDDLSNEITGEFRDLNFDSDMLIVDEDEADEYIDKNASNVLVSYVVMPTDAQPGSYCYKMLINAQTHELYYFRRHKISKKFGPGFLAEDIKRVNSYRGR